MGMMNELVVNELKVKNQEGDHQQHFFSYRAKDILEGIYCTNNLY
jgi:hypothetical protein